MGARACSIVVAVTLLAAGPASAQVINGESTYGDSDLHQPPAATSPPPAETARDDARARSRPAPERR